MFTFVYQWCYYIESSSLHYIFGISPCNFFNASSSCIDICVSFLPTRSWISRYLATHLSRHTDSPLASSASLYFGGMHFLWQALVILLYMSLIISISKSWTICILAASNWGRVAIFSSKKRASLKLSAARGVVANVWFSDPLTDFHVLVTAFVDRRFCEGEAGYPGEYDESPRKWKSMHYYKYLGIKGWKPLPSNVNFMYSVHGFYKLTTFKYLLENQVKIFDSTTDDHVSRYRHQVNKSTARSQNWVAFFLNHKKIDAILKLFIINASQWFTTALTNVIIYWIGLKGWKANPVVFLSALHMESWTTSRADDKGCILLDAFIFIYYYQ